MSRDYKLLKYIKDTTDSRKHTFLQVICIHKHFLRKNFVYRIFLILPSLRHERPPGTTIINFIQIRRVFIFNNMAKYSDSSRQRSLQKISFLISVFFNHHTKNRLHSTRSSQKETLLLVLDWYSLRKMKLSSINLFVPQCSRPLNLKKEKHYKDQSILQTYNFGFLSIGIMSNEAKDQVVKLQNFVCSLIIH